MSPTVRQRDAERRELVDELRIYSEAFAAVASSRDLETVIGVFEQFFDAQKFTIPPPSPLRFSLHRAWQRMKGQWK